MNLEYLKLGVALLNIVVSIFLFLSLQKVNKEKANNEHLAGLQKNINDAVKLSQDGLTTLEGKINGDFKVHSERITKMEGRIEHTLTHPDMADIHEKVNEVSDCVSRLEGEFEGAKHTLDLIQEFLMKGGRK